MRVLLAAVLIFAAAPALGAQVGVPPERSPYRDIDYRMEMGLRTGYFSAGSEPVGVGPQSAPYIGGLYDVSFGSLVSLTGRTGIVPTKRTVIDPSRPAGDRTIGEESFVMILSDVGLTFNITGARTFHGFAPSVTFGLGAITSMQSRDLGGFGIGARLMTSVGGGVKYVLSPEWLVRADFTDHMFKLPYPARYQEPASDGSRVRDRSGSHRMHNLNFTLGISRRFFR